MIELWKMLNVSDYYPPSSDLRKSHPDHRLLILTTISASHRNITVHDLAQWLKRLPVTGIKKVRTTGFLFGGQPKKKSNNPPQQHKEG
jgi:hypothetical protein